MDWKEIYDDVKEFITSSSPKPLGKVIDVCIFISSNHAGKKDKMFLQYVLDL